MNIEIKPNANLIGANLIGANLSGANLSGLKGIFWSSCGFNNHGEMGRVENAVVNDNEIIFYCGCFIGNKKQLQNYINNGDENFKKSRRIAMNFNYNNLKQYIK